MERQRDLGGVGHQNKQYRPHPASTGRRRDRGGADPQIQSEEVQKWGEELCEPSPTAIAIAKRSFNMDTAHQAGIAGMGMYALKLYYDTDELKERVNALKEKRKPEFRKYVK